ncbi:MAG: glycosyltransferase, partial [Prevotella sp.]
DKLRILAHKLNLANVSFEGRQQSEPYYEKAALFMMTSAVEGWGLTLTESMQRGVVPIVFNSYPALRDIISDGYNGCVVPNNNLDTYADCMMELMENKEKRENIARNALKSCKRFEPEKVIRKWIELIDSL